MLAKQKIKWCSICSDYSVFLYFSRVSTRLGSNVLFEGRFFSKRLKNQKNSSKSILSKKPYLMDVLQFIVHFCHPKKIAVKFGSLFKKTYLQYL